MPDVALDKTGFGEATVYDCLLSQEWTWSSGPCEDTRSPDDVGPGRADEAPDDPGTLEVGRDLPIHWKDTRHPGSRP